MYYLVTKQYLLFSCINILKVSVRRDKVWFYMALFVTLWCYCVTVWHDILCHRIHVQTFTCIYLASLPIPLTNHVHIENGCYLLMPSSPGLQSGQHSTATITIIIMMTIMVAVTVVLIMRWALSLSVARIPYTFFLCLSRLRAVSLFLACTRAARREKRSFFSFFSHLQSRAFAFSRGLFDGLRNKRDCL